MDLPLAAPATGPVDAVWFSSAGSTLYARTHSGQAFETADFENWSPVAQPPAPPAAPDSASAARLPEPGARVQVFPSDPGRIWALGANLYRSEDGGRSWANLTALGRASVIGSGQRALAVMPGDPDQIVVANDSGVWRSLDGGISWAGLNARLPNLMARKILRTPAGAAGARLLVEGAGVLELPPGNSGLWEPAASPSWERQEQARSNFSLALGALITAVAFSGETVYAGSQDGRIWVSFDSGRNWPTVAPAAGGAIEDLWADPQEPRVALAAVAGNGARVLRTTNAGLFWDNLTSDLPQGAVHALSADRVSGAIYAASDRGVYYARADLENPGPAPVQWQSLSANLPSAPAMDVTLDSGGNQLYAALQGYGVYATLAPHRLRSLQLVNAADFSSRPAAPGSLLSVLGGRVNAARAGGLNFPVLAASDSESQIQVPFEARGPNLALDLETSKGRFSFGLPLDTVSPAIFVGRDGTPMLLDADTGLMLDAGNAAHSSARIQILATGLGKVRPDWPTGMAAPLENPPAAAATVQAYLDRVPVPVTKAVLAPGYVGFYVVELQLPAIVNAGPAELYLSVEGQDSNRVRIFLEP